MRLSGCRLTAPSANQIHAGMHFFGGPDAAEGEPVYALSDHETEKARYW